MKAGIVVATMTLFLSMIALADGPSATFFGNPKAKLVTSFSLKPNQAKDLSISAKKETWVYFDTDATFEIQKKYLHAPPVSLGVRDGNSVGGTSGGLPCIPTNGTIHLIVTNKVDHTFTVSVYAAIEK